MSSSATPFVYAWDRSSIAGSFLQPTKPHSQSLGGSGESAAVLPNDSAPLTPGAARHILREIMLNRLAERVRYRMINKSLICLVLLAGAAGFCAPVFAHHGAAAYLDKISVLKDATVTKFVWANPHSILLFDVKDDKGGVTHWAGEAGSPSAIGLLGWNRNSVQPGDVITVYIFPAKTGNPVGRLNKIVFADGRELRDSQLGGYKSKEQ
jgi:Family of unknown function (DUF6152)